MNTLKFNCFRAHRAALDADGCQTFPLAYDGATKRERRTEGEVPAPLTTWRVAEGGHKGGGHSLVCPCSTLREEEEAKRTATSPWLEHIRDIGRGAADIQGAGSGERDKGKHTR